MIFKSVFFAAALLALGAPALAINKCTGADGKVSFQDAPCVGGKTETLGLKSGGVITPLPVANKPTNNAAQLNAQGKIADAIMAGEPLVGMTVAELNRAMGAPTKVNADDYNGVKKDQVIYERVGVTWLVYTEAGVVTAVQKRPESNAVASRPAVVCPSAQEIRNMETSASSRTLSDAIRVEMLKQIRDAKNCGR